MLAGVLASCASTQVVLTPAPQPPACDPSARGLLVWAPAWRADQKDVAQREEAAGQGLQAFAREARCFASTGLRRAASAAEAARMAGALQAEGREDRVVVILVRELGPVLRIGASAALVEGGTEVVLDISVHAPPPGEPPRTFTARWSHGGAGVVRGVASLPADMRAALAAALQPRAGRPATAAP